MRNCANCGPTVLVRCWAIKKQYVPAHIGVEFEELQSVEIVLQFSFILISSCTSGCELSLDLAHVITNGLYVVRFQCNYTEL